MEHSNDADRSSSRERDSGSFATGPIQLADAALFTDLYELTMAAAYLRRGMTQPATFSLFVRRFPETRGFLVAAGLEDALEYLRAFRFSARALDYLRSLDKFDEGFLRALATLRFTGDVRAVAEGTVMFPDEPLLEITAPMIEAQLVETAVLNFVHFQTTLASKAARVVRAAHGRPVVEFGLRRAHGIDAGMKAARCSYIAGAEMSSNVLAGLTYGIPPTGTMAHSFVTAFPDEIESFRTFAETFPQNAILLIDTFDTVRGAEKAVTVAREMAQRGEELKAVRLDSGDLDSLSHLVRAILDDAGLESVQIFASGGLDEVAVGRLTEDGAPIDAFGVGTRMDVSADAPYLDIAYKLVRYADRDVLKLSAGKQTWAGEKQVYRFSSGKRFEKDLLARRGEPLPPGAAEGLLVEVMKRGELTGPHPRLVTIREHCAAELAALPEGVAELENPRTYPVEYSDQLIAHQNRVKASVLADTT